ncbi:DUF2637 domain-containing protein [Frankia sp. Cas3]|uniref:DUF2637 domain-containing protein n=1 Tax=Frankia sp. Cas3 TaxID=3073926 RepID=UPI002AD589C1|nr:DUF2637 domain-containing protein [Frankia sp. Cas3]
MTGERLHRIRWAVRAVLALGVAASVAANILAARPSIPGRVIAAWSPLALLLTIELISRVPVHRPGLAWVRRGATAAISSIAAWVSYWHMVEVCGRYGETATSAHLIPISVDGLVVVASVCLVEIGGHLAAPALEAKLPPEGESHAGETVTVGSGRGLQLDDTSASQVVQPEPPNPVVDEPLPVQGAPLPRTPGSRHRVAELVSKIPADDGRSTRQLAEDLAPLVGVAPATVRRHLSDLRREVSA